MAKVAIIGAGFTGLAAAIKLSKNGHNVTVFERETQPGGLAIGFKDDKWEWNLDKHYHHLFTSDKFILDLAKEVGHNVNFYLPKTSTYVNGKIYQLDSPTSLLKFSELSFLERLRTAFGLACLKFNPFWQPFEHTTAEKFIKFTMGEKSWKIIWEPLMVGKFGEYSSKISAAWFWARIYKRSTSLGYPDGGFQSLAESIARAVINNGGKIVYNKTIEKISDLTTEFDKVICTLPTQVFAKMSGLRYEKNLGLGAINLIVALKKPYFSDGTYWLNNNDRNLPYLAAVEHTNFVDKGHYGGDHLIYIGNYLPANHKYFSLEAKELLNIYLPRLKNIRKFWVWKADYAQPVVTLNHSKKIPPLVTAIPNVYLANIQQVYPWDRGTNYAVELGIEVAKLCE
jgi:protoporphyrinogen oxidase